MPASGYTPISLYYSSTTTNVPLNTDLVAGELAINITDGKLFYKDNANVVQVIGTKGGVGSSTNTQVLYNSSGLVVGSANLTFNGTTLTTGGLTTTGTTSTGVLSVTGNTTLGDAAADTVTVNGTVTSNLIFTDNTYDIGASGATRPRNLYLAGNAVVAGSTTLSGGTANGVAYLNGSKVLTSGSGLTYDGTNVRLGGAGSFGADYRFASSGGRAAFVGNSDPYNIYIQYNSATTGFFIGSPAANTLAFYTGGAAEVGRLDSSGNLLINTTSAVSGSKLVVASADATIYGITVGRGAGAVSTNTAVGANALAANTTGGYSNAVGQNALKAQTTANGNNAFGNGAMFSTTTGGYNSAFGNSALYSNTVGANNSAFGSGSLYANTGDYNSAFGQSALTSNTSGAYNTAVGSNALVSNTTASYNTAVGYQAGYTNTTGVAITALGYQAAYSGSTVNYTTAVGYQAAYTTTGEHNAALGDQALYLTTTGAYNTAIGNLALRANTTASNNTAVGYQAAYSNTTGGIQAFGYQAGRGNTTGLYNTYVGDLAGYTASTANSNTGIGYNTLRFATGGGHTAVGESALYANTTGASNTAIGVGALTSNTTASNNTAVGYQAGYSGTTATDNTFVGSLAGYTTTSSCNIAIGRSAMYYNSTGANNVAIGAGITGVAQGALGNNTTGSNNIAIGVSALLANTTASYNTAVGYQALYNANRTADANAYNTAIGYGSGSAITTGAKNSILGAYTGNQGGLDIRTASNYIVLSDGDGNPRQVIDGSGNVGIGVTPSASSSLIKAFDFNTTGGIGSYSNSTSTQFTYVSSNAFINSSVNWAYKLTGYAAAAYMQNNGSAAHAWLTAPSGTAGNAITFTQAMTLDASGNLLVGGSTASGKFVVTGALSNTYIPSDGNGITFTRNSTNYITANGGGSATIQVISNTNGVQLSNGATSWTAVSDERQKDIIEPIVDAASKVSAIRAVIGKYKTDAEGTRRSFLIAQDVQAVLPEAVSQIQQEDGSDVLGLSYTDTIPLLVAAIQEQQALIQSLTARIAALEAK